MVRKVDMVRKGFKLCDLWWFIYIYNIKICKIYKIFFGEYVDYYYYWMYKVGCIWYFG